MFKKKKQKTSLTTILFVICSLVGLVFLIWFFYSIKLNILATKQYNEKFSQEEIYPKFIKTDPFITKVVWPEDEIKEPLINAFDPNLGERNAKVKIFYFTDFECEFCRAQEEDILKLAEEYGDDIFVVRKDYPLTDVNSFSWQAAIAGRCAAEQRGFWKFRDLLAEQIIKNSSRIVNLANDDFFTDLAGEADLSAGIFSACLADEEIAVLVRNNIIEAQILGIKGIPFIYVNDKEVMGDISYEELKRMIERELQKN